MKKQKEYLKTLKDILTDECFEPDDGTIFKVKVKLRQEAIKWIKNIRENKTYRSPIWNELNDYREGRDMLISWIKHFFNIEEEELK